MRLSYPSKSFGVRSAEVLQHEQPLEIAVARGWRRRLIEKSVGLWPESEHIDSDFAAKAGWSWLICNLLCPTLLVVHWTFVRAGYTKAFGNVEGDLIITYKRDDPRLSNDGAP